MDRSFRTIAEQKRIALVAHDQNKARMVEWAQTHQTALRLHVLYATASTGELLIEKVNLDINLLQSGPLGGDQQLGGLIAEGLLDVLVFFWDPLACHVHHDDVNALLRLATAYNVLLASNTSTASLVITSPLFARPMDIEVPRTFICNGS